MTPLERRYRRMLVVLPRWYRAEREDEMVAAFLEDAEVRNTRRWPGWGEFGSLLALSARTRWPGTSGSPRALVKGQVVRLVALMGLFLESAAVLVGWQVQHFPELSGYHHKYADGPGVAPAPRAFEWFDLVWLTHHGAVLLCFLAMLYGAHRVAKVAAGVVLLFLATHLVLLVIEPDSIPLYSLVYCLSSILFVLCVFAGFHSDAPPFDARRWVAALVAFTLVVIGMSWTPDLANHAVFVAAAVIFVIGHHVKLWRVSAAWMLAGAVFVVTVLAGRLAFVPAFLEGTASPGEGMALATAEMIGIAVLAVWLWVQAVKLLPARSVVNSSIAVSHARG